MVGNPRAPLVLAQLGAPRHLSPLVQNGGPAAAIVGWLAGARLAPGAAPVAWSKFADWGAWASLSASPARVPVPVDQVPA
eukprot:2042350-Alexandrium_andersonii.AAC.1